MTYNDALEYARLSALKNREDYYVFHDLAGEFYFGDGEDATENFFPEEIVATIHPDGVAVDHSAFLNPAEA